MKLIFGPGLGNDTFSEKDFVENLQKVLQFSNEAIELSFTDSNEVYYSKKVSSLFKQFKYKSIHLPVVTKSGGEKFFLKYPNDGYSTFLDIIDKIIDDSKPDTILVHPDQINNFEYFNKKYGTMLAFENMDNRKEFGKTVKDMEKAFKNSPQAKWVFDVNHVYTNDHTMNQADDFYNNFKEKITHYHLSGFGGFHDAISVSREDIILNGIKSVDVPIIDEGNLMKKDILLSEYEYVYNRLRNKFNLN
jgi:hypothetical protein